MAVGAVMNNKIQKSHKPVEVPGAKAGHCA